MNKKYFISKIIRKHQNLKRHFLIFSILFFVTVPNKIIAQLAVTPGAAPVELAVSGMEEAIDIIYGKLDTNNYPTKILMSKAPYDPRIKFADGSLNDSVFDYYDWLFSYNNLRYSSLHPYGFINELSMDSLLQIDNVSNQIINIGVQYYKYNIIKDDALENGFLTFDQNSIIESGNPTDIYEEKLLFLASPLLTEVNSNSVQYILRNEYLLMNQNNISNIYIDFDDGEGFILIGLNEVNSILYNSEGVKIITVKFALTNGQDIYCKSRIIVHEPFESSEKRNSPYTNPDYGPVNISADNTIHPKYKGGTTSGSYAIWYAFNNCDKVLRKPLIVSGGFNPKDGKALVFDNNFVENYIAPKIGDVVPGLYSGWRGLLYETYDGTYNNFSFDPPSDDQKDGRVGEDNGNDWLKKMRREGYDVIIVKYDDGVGYVQNNAQVMIEVIKKVNQLKTQGLNPGASLNPLIQGYPNISTSDANKSPAHFENIIGGFSAGALTTRYALTQMEYEYNNNWDHTKYPHHNCKLWYSFEGEMQGSNTSLGFQYFLHCMQIFPVLNKADEINKKICKQAFDISNASGVPSQNTLYNLNGDYPNSGSMIEFINPTHVSDFDDYWDELAQLTYFRNLGYYKSALIGYPQDCRRIGIGQGSMIGTENTCSGQMYHYKVKEPFLNSGGTWQKTLNSYYLSSTGTNLLMNSEVKINYFGKDAIFTNWAMMPNLVYTLNTIPYDKAPASTMATTATLNGIPTFKSLGALTFGRGEWEVFNINNLNAFAPTVSLFDLHDPNNNYQPAGVNVSPEALNLNYVNIDDRSGNHGFGYPHLFHPSDRYKITPFDAICGVGTPDNDEAHTGKNNQFHVEDPQPSFGEFMIEEMAPRTLYLADRIVGQVTPGETYYADFEAPEKIIAGNGKIYNDISPKIIPTPDNDFTIASNGIVTMRAVQSISLKPGFSAKNGSVFRAYINADEFDQNNCNNGSWAVVNSTEENQAQRGSAGTEDKLEKAKLVSSVTDVLKQENLIAVYPNPVANFVIIKREDSITDATVNIIDINGKIAISEELKININKINTSNLEPGIYLLSIKSNDTISNFKIIKQ